MPNRDQDRGVLLQRSGLLLRCVSLLFLSGFDLAARSLFAVGRPRSLTKARTMRMLIRIARALLSTEESMATPCSVKA